MNQMKVVRLALLMISVFAAICTAYSNPQQPKVNVKSDPEVLISDLVGINCQVTDDLHLPVTKDESQGTKAAKILVRLGVKALPALLNHLTDERPTQWVEPKKFWSQAISHTSFYDPRQREDYLRPNADVMFTNSEFIDKYKLKVGDVCYWVIGQIVNRFLLPAFSIKATRINSPVHTRSLANWTRRDWSDLTQDEHRKQLEHDVVNNVQPANAMRLLFFYYPTHGEKFALRLLNRAFYDEGEISHLVYDQLLETDNEDQWRSILSAGKKRIGNNAYNVIPANLGFYARPDYPLEPQKSRSTKILKLFFSTHNPYENSVDEVANFDDMNDIVNGARDYASNTLDKAIHQMFRRALIPPIHPLPDEDAWETRRARTCILAERCAERLMGKGFDDEYRAFFENYLQFIKTKATKDWEKDTAEICEKWIVKLNASSKRLLRSH